MNYNEAMIYAIDHPGAVVARPIYRGRYGIFFHNENFYEWFPMSNDSNRYNFPYMPTEGDKNSMDWIVMKE